MHVPSRVAERESRVVPPGIAARRPWDTAPHVLNFWQDGPQESRCQEVSEGTFSTMRRRFVYPVLIRDGRSRSPRLGRRWHRRSRNSFARRSVRSVARQTSRRRYAAAAGVGGDPALETPQRLRRFLGCPGWIWRACVTVRHRCRVRVARTRLFSRKTISGVTERVLLCRRSTRPSPVGRRIFIHTWQGENRALQTFSRFFIR